MVIYSLQQRLLLLSGNGMPQSLLGFDPLQLCMTVVISVQGSARLDPYGQFAVPIYVLAGH